MPSPPSRELCARSTDGLLFGCWPAQLNFLISNPPFPPETFVNLMLLYCKHQYYDLAADVLAENAHLTFQFLSPDL